MEAALPDLRAAAAAEAEALAKSDSHPAGGSGPKLSGDPSGSGPMTAARRSTGSVGSGVGGSGAGLPGSQLRELLCVAAVTAVAAAQSAPGDAELALAVRGVQVLLISLPLVLWMSENHSVPGWALVMLQSAACSAVASRKQQAAAIHDSSKRVRLAVVTCLGCI